MDTSQDHNMVDHARRMYLEALTGKKPPLNEVLRIGDQVRNQIVDDVMPIMAGAAAHRLKIKP